MAKQFRITRRHYDIIIRQGLKNLPTETGGFLGGKDGFIQAILPTYNLKLGDATSTYEITQDDVSRAKKFFKQHGLGYYGVYHTHPEGIAYPSAADLATKEKYHFIIGLSDPKVPILNAFECHGDKVVQIPINIETSNKYDVKDLKNKEPEKHEKLGITKEEGELHDLLDNIRQENPKYLKEKPRDPFSSDFSTQA